MIITFTIRNNERWRLSIDFVERSRERTANIERSKNKTKQKKNKQQTNNTITKNCRKRITLLLIDFFFCSKVCVERERTSKYESNSKKKFILLFIIIYWNWNHRTNKNKKRKYWARFVDCKKKWENNNDWIFILWIAIRFIDFSL